MLSTIRKTQKIFNKAALTLVGFTSLSLSAAHADDAVVGNLSGEFSVNSGNLSYVLPIVTPEGIHGLQPDISITYSNASGAGLLGAGFTLSTSNSISRCNANVDVDGFKAGIELNANARFCFGGQKLIAIAGEDGSPNSEYRDQEDNNARYFARGGSNYTPDYWEMHSPEGYKYKYEKISTPHTRFSAWFLTEKSDFFGNTIQYHYSAGVMPVLQSINYSGYNVSFQYENREQPITQYRDGHRFELDKRLNAIILSRANTEINRYRFTYESIVPDDGQLPLEPLEKLKRLAQVDKCYGPNGQDGCLRPLTFNYQEQPNAGLGLDNPEDRTVVVPRSYYADSDHAISTQLYERPSYAAADMNKDGLSDFCYYRVGTGIMCALSNAATGSYAPPVAWTGDLGYQANEDDYSYYSQLQLIDLNADTYTDVCLTDSQGVRCALNNNGNGLNNVHYRLTQLDFDGSPSFSFVDDDIYPDVCGLTSNNSAYQCFAGTASGFNSSPIINLNGVVDNRRIITSTSSYTSDDEGEITTITNTEEKEINMPPAQWIDIDGDLDNDLCWLSASNNAFTCSYRSRNPSSQAIVMSAAQPVLSLNYPVYSPSADFDSVRSGARRFVTSFRIADVNADLLPDVCYANGHQYNCTINQGGSFASASQWINVASLYQGFTEDADLSSLVTIRLDDMNLDGLADFCLVLNQQQHCAYNQIGSFGDLSVRQAIAADVDSNLETQQLYENFVRKLVDKGVLGAVAVGVFSSVIDFGSWKTVYITGASNLAYGNLINVPDINGDGYPEFCYRSIHGILCTSNDNYTSSALLTGITDSFGQTTEITYGSLISDNLYTPATNVPTGYYEQPSNSLVVDTVKVSTGVIQDNFPYNTPIINSQSYRYQGFLVNPTTGVSGYSSVTVKQNERDVSTTMHLSVEEDLVGREIFIEEFIGNKRLKTKRNVYSVVNESNNRHRVRLDQVEEKQFDLDGALVSTMTTTSANFDQYGYPRQATSQKIMAEDGEQLTTISTTEYLHDTQNWILARPDLQTVEHQYQGNSQTRVVDYHFANGVMTGETMQPSATNAVEVSYVYDVAGNIITETTTGSGQARSVNKTFDSLGRVTSLTNSLGQSEQFTYHNTCPSLISHRDVAGKLTTTSYDFACRQLRVDAPDGNATTWDYKWATDADNAQVNRPINHPYNYRNPIVYTVKETQANGIWTQTSFDAQGRDVRTENVGFSSERFNRAVVGDKVFDRFGRTTATTLPYYRINGEYITPSWMTVEHDEASRPKTEKKIAPDGSLLTTYYHYSKNTTTLSYADYSKTTQTGVFGEPISVNENGLTILYSYDPLGNLLTTNQAGVVTNLVYDSRGFKIQQTDPAMGTWNYAYNAFGEVISQTDAKGQTTSFVYDELGRVIERLSPEGETRWIYNTTGYGIGQLKEEQGIDATKQWAYDNLGRTISETLLVDDQQFVTQYEYDIYSRLHKTINPNGLEIYNEFGKTGALNRVSIPANQVQGFDVQVLKGEYEAILLALVEVEANIDSLEERRAYHLAKAVEYENQALHYLDLLNIANAEIERLTMLSRQHEDLAARYQQAVNDLRAQAAVYRSLYGDRVFTYLNNENGTFNFRASWCSDRHRVWGGCKTRQTRFVSISSSDFNAIEGGQPVYASYLLPAVCRKVKVTIGVPSEDEEGAGNSRTEVHCSPPTIVSEPTCVNSYFGEDEGAADIRRVCTTIRPHEIYTRAANDFATLRDNEIAQAEAFQAQITEGGNPVGIPVLKHEPTGVILDSWTPIITGDLTVMIPVKVPETREVWTTLSLEETVAYYEEKINYYAGLAAQELDSYNELSRDWEEAASDFDDLTTAKFNFAEILQASGILVGDDKDVVELLDDAETRQLEWEDNSTPLMVWAATMRSPFGFVENEIYGNGLYTKRTVSRDTGLVTAIETSAYSADTPLRRLDYRFDQRGMIVEKSDTTSTQNQTTEHYTYDQQGRLRSWGFDQHIDEGLEEGEAPRHNQLWRSYDYDNRGNMAYKTGAGNMYYNAANQLTSRDVTAGLTVNYSYDANGNMLVGDNRNYQWNSFNKVDTVTRGGHTVNFNYDANYRRVVKKSNLETIYYVNPNYEKVIKHYSQGDEVIHRHNIWSADDVVATFEKKEEANGETEMGDDVKYYHRDHLGNGELVTGSDMNVLAQRYYTPFGELVEDVLQREGKTSTSLALALNYNTEDYMREIIDNNDSLGSDLSLLSEAMFENYETKGDYRGFTSHEHIKEIGLVNMNARLYDPVIARFASADSMIPDAGDPQAYNRYIYVKNNPMLYRDPTGHFWQIALAAFTAAQLTDNQALQQITTAILSASLAFPGSGSVAAGPFAAAKGSGFIGASISAFQTTLTVSFLQTGDVKSSVRAAVFSSVAAGVSNYIGHSLKINGKPPHWTVKASLHGLAQGAISDLRGDGFAAGFVSGLASSVSGHYSQGLDDANRVLLAMVSGYISASATGGDGFQGALNAAIVFLYNDLGEQTESSLKPTEEEYQMVAEGNLAGMWEGRCAAGDPIGCVGFATWGDAEDVIAMHGKVDGAYWIGVGMSVRFNARHGLLTSNPGLLLDIEAFVAADLALGKAIANAHLDATAADLSGRHYFLSAPEITDYHHVVFDQFNISRRWYGGSYVAGVHAPILEPFYCQPSCDEY